MWTRFSVCLGAGSFRLLIMFGRGLADDCLLQRAARIRQDVTSCALPQPFRLLTQTELHGSIQRRLVLGSFATRFLRNAGRHFASRPNLTNSIHLIVPQIGLGQPIYFERLTQIYEEVILRLTTGLIL